MKAILLSFCFFPYILLSQNVWTKYDTQNSDLTYNVINSINQTFPRNDSNIIERTIYQGISRTCV